jgi:thiol:disulfide interchange protein DsbA
MIMPNRRHFLAAAALPVISAQLPASAQEAFVEGKHYTRLGNVQPTRDPKRVEVLEFFAYGCSHCYAFEPALDAWQKKLPPDVLFRRIPVAFREGTMVLHQKLYFALETLNLVDRVHHKVFEAIHAQKQRLDTEDEIGAFAAKSGVDRSRLLEAMNSFSVAGRAKQASQLVSGYGIEGTPSMGVNGRWLTSGSQAGSNAKSLVVVDYLIGLAKQAR